MSNFLSGFYLGYKRASPSPLGCATIWCFPYGQESILPEIKSGRLPYLFLCIPRIWSIKKAKGSLPSGLSCLRNTVSKLCHMEPSDLCWVPRGEKAQTDLIPMLWTQQRESRPKSGQWWVAGGLSLHVSEGRGLRLGGTWTMYVKEIGSQELYLRSPM